MFLTPLQKILDALRAAGDFKTVDVWQGDVKELLDQVQKLPSAHVIMSAAEFDIPYTIGASTAPSKTTWSIVIIFESRASVAAGATAGYVLLETVLSPAVAANPGDKTGLTRLDTGAGFLWPDTVQLLGSEQGKTAYGFKFTVETGD